MARMIQRNLSSSLAARAGEHELFRGDPGGGGWWTDLDREARYHGFEGPARVYLRSLEMITHSRVPVIFAYRPNPDVRPIAINVAGQLVLTFPPLIERSNATAKFIASCTEDFAGTFVAVVEWEGR